jgi:hypothetical protein
MGKAGQRHATGDRAAKPQQAIILWAKRGAKLEEFGYQPGQYRLKRLPALLMRVPAGISIAFCFQNQINRPVLEMPTPV